MRIVLLTSLLLAACSVGEVGTVNNNAPDGGNGSGDGGGSGNGCVDRITPAGDAHEHGGTGGPTHAGENCIQSLCHLNSNLGPNAPGYQFAGTLYVAGTTNPQAGATVRIKPATGAALATVTDAAGNFHFPAGSLSGTFSAATDVTACPTVTSMVAQLVSGGGAGANSCNSCHAKTGGTTTPITM
jgi:hypothetical protein